ncbi:MAG: bifunctional response regulator/alkaline phosphatase family protein [Candidatus Krumholzibacteria bacterium]|nr:bifunctional response regulator/alkaline phosphatase family protein [Candidatus Krumholzibacteria bacterium]
MKAKRILWVDDEIDLLRSHLIFLDGKGYETRGVSSGEEALRLLGDDQYDLILLDETMPGMSGLETLQGIKEISANIPVIMITKNEAEGLMDQAIGMKIDDYLLKPVSPLQIFSAVKRALEAHRIQQGAASKDYLQVFRRVDEALAARPGWREWMQIHQELCTWDVEFDRFGGTGMDQIHGDLRGRCNVEFARFVEERYPRWAAGDDAPPMSPGVFGRCVLPHLSAKRKVYFIVIDCMRYDQWLTVEDMLAPYFTIERDAYYSILPTATPYSRNAIFAGLFPLEIQQRYPDWWTERSRDELSKNRFESELMGEQLRRARLDVTTKYVKIYAAEEANEIRKQVDSYRAIDLVALVFNFLDILAHGRSQSEILQEIAPNEGAFRSLMRSWFTHSALFEILQKISRHEGTVVITTDHGSILGQKASLVHGNRDTSTNLRYKFGENINGDPKQTVLVRRPAEYRLPAEGPSKNYILARENYYFVYPTRFHEYEKQYQGTFQHGGISLEEMIVPCITLTPR